MVHFLLTRGIASQEGRTGADQRDIVDVPCQLKRQNKHMVLIFCKTSLKEGGIMDKADVKKEYRYGVSLGSTSRS
jgi:hypothetical protein